MASVTLVRIFANRGALKGGISGSRHSRRELNAWYGPVHTLHDVSLQIPANHATALIGPSGCGKSTFVRCLNRMHETSPGARAEGRS